MFRRYIGTREFYRKILVLTIPIMVQNFITNFVNMLDNVMVGQVGTVPMTGVAVANQLIFIFNLCIFGAVSGAGIFGAQYAGCGDAEGLRHTFRFKIISCTVITGLVIGALLLWSEPLVKLYLQGEGDLSDIEGSLGFAKEYIAVMLIGLLPYAIVQCYSSTLRETGQTVVPMVAGIIAVLVNLTLNYFLIFDHFGYKGMGVKGAAIATVISRFAELIIVAGWTHRNAGRNPFIIGAYRSLRIPAHLIKQIAVKGLPLMFNETFWSIGMAILNQQYSLRSYDVVGATSISSTFFNVFSVAFMAVGAAISIVIGQQLGAGDTEGARDSSRKLIAFAVFVGAVVGAVYAGCSFFIPEFYKATESVQHLASKFMFINAVFFPVNAFAHATYFTLRSGGKTLLTVLFDSCFVWVVNVPMVFLLVNLTAVDVLVIFALEQAANIIKCIGGYILVKKGIWVKNLVKPEEA